MQNRWIRGLLAAVLAVLAACGGADSDDSLKGTTFNGTLSGGKSGTFTFTVNDDDGNGTGTATIAGKTYSLGGGVAKNGSFAISILSGVGVISGSVGSVTKSDMSGAWYASLPISTSSATKQNYEGAVSASASKASSGDGSSAGGATGASCGIENYQGPKDDPQTWTICASAYSYKCIGDATNAAKTCTFLNGTLKAYGNPKTAASYCPAYCN